MKKRIDKRLLDQHEPLSAKADARRNAIIRAMIHSVATRGIHETSLFSVAKDMKTTRSLVTHYFKNIDALLEASVHYVLQVGQEITVSRLVTSMTPEDALRAIVEATFDWFERDPEHACLVQLSLYYSSFDPRYQKLGVTMRDQAEARLLAVIDADPRWKRVPPKKRAERARAIRHYHLGSVVSLYSCPRPEEVEGYREAVLEVTRRLLDP